MSLLLLVPPAMVEFARSALVSQYDLSSIRQVSSGAAALSRQTELDFSKVAGVRSVRQGICHFARFRYCHDMSSVCRR